MKILKNVAVGFLIITIAVVITFVMRLYFFKFDKKLTKEQKTVIEEYLNNLDSSGLAESMTFMSTHYFGNRYNNDKLEVYVWVMFSEYDTSNGSFKEYSGYSIPHVVTVNTKDGKFEITGSTIPKDGSYYSKSIKSMFPLTIRIQVSNFYNTKEYKNLLKEHDKLIKVYENYTKESE
ncbi:MAG: hypothetical protein IJO43_01940 [Bacilli bacterium]|nr:hypothetical protein [Bacilli bacterium]